MDVNKDGKLDTNEIINAFKRLGVKIEQQEAIKLIKRMKKEGSLEISFEEWRDFLLLYPSSNLKELMKSWRHGTVRMLSLKTTFLKFI